MYPHVRGKRCAWRAWPRQGRRNRVCTASQTARETRFRSALMWPHSTRRMAGDTCPHATRRIAARRVRTRQPMAAQTLWRRLPLLADLDDADGIDDTVG